MGRMLHSKEFQFNNFDFLIKLFTCYDHVRNYIDHSYGKYCLVFLAGVDDI